MRPLDEVRIKAVSNFKKKRIYGCKDKMNILLEFWLLFKPENMVIKWNKMIINRPLGHLTNPFEKYTKKWLSLH